MFDSESEKIAYNFIAAAKQRTNIEKIFYSFDQRSASAVPWYPGVPTDTHQNFKILGTAVVTQIFCF